MKGFAFLVVLFCLIENTIKYNTFLKFDHNPYTGQ